MTTLPLTVRVELFYDGQWNDITDHVRGQPSEGYGISLSRGRSNQSQHVNAASADLTLSDPEYRFSDINPNSPLFGKIGLNTPIRVVLVDPDVPDANRIIAESTDWSPRIGLAEHAAAVAIEAAGVMQRLAENSGVPLSPIRQFYRNLDRILPNFPGLVVSYLPLEEGNTQTGETGNDIEGVGGMAYDTSGDRAPQFGDDDTIPGSASLPDWPVIDYFGWSTGAGILTPPDGPYGFQVTCRIPEGSGELWLLEWSGTGGTFSQFALKVDASGFVEVSGEAEDGSTFTYTASALNTVDDGVPRHIHVSFGSGVSQTAAIVVDGQRSLFTTPGATPARPERIRPRPMFASSTGKDPISMGHVVVLAWYPATASSFPSELDAIAPPVDGYFGEEDSERVRRVALLQGVPAKIMYRTIASDEFNRVETNGWGDADTGQEWVIQQGATSNFFVDGQEANLETLGTGIASYATTGNLNTMNGEILVQVGFADFDPTDGVIAMTIGRHNEDGFYSADISIVGGSDATLSISQWSGLTENLLASLILEENATFTSDDRWWIRFQVVGPIVRAKAWMAGEEEPPLWQVEEEDSNFETGRWGLGANSSSGYVETVLFDHFALLDATPTVRLGVQEIGNPLSLMRDSAFDGHGVLFESRSESIENPNAAGISYKPLVSMYNPTPLFTINYQACQLRRPLLPSRDHRYRVNDMTVSGSGGTTARVVEATGPMSVQKPPDGVGRYAKSESTQLHSLGQLQDWAGWAVNLGTQNVARFDLIRIRNQAPQSCPTDPHFAQEAAALDTTEVMHISNLPGWHPPEPAEILIQGYSETIDKYNWLFGYGTSPANAYHVGFLFTYPADEFIGSTLLGQLAPSINLIRNAILICGWISVFTPGDYDLSGTGLTAQPESDGNFSTYVEGYTEVPPGDSGRRTAQFDSTVTSSAQFSVGIYGSNGPPTLSQHFHDFATASPITLNTDADTPVGAWLVAVQAWDWDPIDEMSDSPGGTALSWVLVSDTQITDNSNPHVRVWVARVETAGSQMVTFPVGTQTDDHHARLWVFTDAQMILPSAQQRYDSFGTTVAASFHTTDSSMQVALDNDEDLWTTDPNHFGFEIMVEGARLEVEAVSGSSSPQTFTISLVNGIEKTIEAGAKVSLYREPIWGI